MLISNRSYRPFLAAIAGVCLVPPCPAADDAEDAWDVRHLPGAAREIPIDTGSGTWMSLDLSPDGATIAFDLLGDIYLLPIAGGQAQPIASGLDWSIQPRFSPDGSEIAFISDAGGGDNIWIMKADGSGKRQVSKEDFQLLNNPTWSPDGQYIAARKHFTTTRSLGTGEIWIYHRNGGGGVAVVERPDEEHQKELGEPAYSSDGRYIYYSFDSTPGGTFTYAQDSNAQIFEIRRHELKTGITDSLVTGAGGAVRPEPSPDGRWLAFVRRLNGRSALHLKNLTSGAEFPIYEGLDYDMQEVWGVQGLYPNMGWTPDSGGIVFWAGGRIRRIDIRSGSVSEIPFHVRDTRTVYDPPRPSIEVAPAHFDSRMLRNAAVSPDGSRVVFETAGRLYIRQMPDGDIRPLTRDDRDHFEFFPSWSRDGKSLVFVRWSDKELGHIHTVPAGGARSTRRTTQPGHYRAPRFSPDGDSIVFEAVAGDRLTSRDWSIDTGVFILPARGGDARRLTRDGANPQFGPDPDRVYVTRSIDKAQALVSVDLNGEAPRVHATGKYLKRYALAPDAAHLAYEENYHVYVVPLPPGGKPLELGTAVDSVMLTRASGDGGNYAHWSGDGKMLYWTLGPTLYSARTAELFAPATAEGEPAYRAPSAGVSLSMLLAADVPLTTVALTGARIITMGDEDGGIIDDGAIVIRGNRIAAIGPQDAVDIPADAIVQEVAGHTVIPGLIDAHAHGSQGDSIIPQQNWINYATLAFGVTTIHDPSNDATEIFAAAEMQRTGAILAPRIFSTGDVIYGARSATFAEINSLDDALAHVRRLKAQGAISVKNYIQPRRNQRQQVAAAARMEDVLVVAEGGALFHMDLSLVADGNSAIEHNLPQSMLYDDVLQFWEQTRVAYTPTFGVTYGGLRGEDYWYQESEVWKNRILSAFVPPHVLRPRAIRRLLAPYSEYYHGRSAATARLLADRGILVSIGAHGQREGLASHWEMWSLRLGGFSDIEALRAATIVPATALGMERDIGSLEVGKLADLAVIPSEAFDEGFQTDRVRYVMLNGRLYDAETLNEIATGNRRTEPFYWQLATGSPQTDSMRRH